MVDFGKDLERWDEAKREMMEAVRNMEPSVYVKNRVRFDWSDLDVSFFWVSGVVDRMHSIPPEEGQDYTYGGMVYFQYNCEMSDIPVMQKEIERATEAILAKIPANADEWETAKIVHDEVARIATYDHSLEGRHIRDIYGVLEEGSAVCVGYAYAFDYLLEQAPNGPACITRESADRAHAWNGSYSQMETAKAICILIPHGTIPTRQILSETPIFLTTTSVFPPMNWKGWMTATRSALLQMGKIPRRSIIMCARGVI